MMQSKRNTILMNILSIFVASVYLFVSFVSKDPSIYQVSFGILIVIQVVSSLLYINTFTLVYLENFKTYKPTILDKFTQYYAVFIVLLAVIGLIEFWWYLIISFFVSIIATVIKVGLLLTKKMEIKL